MLKRLLNKAIFDQDLYAYYLTALNPLLIELFENPKISVHILEPNILSPKIKERFEALQLYTEQLVQLLTDSISDFPGCLEFNKIFDGTMPVPHKLLTTYEHNRFHINSDNKIVNCTDSQRHLVMGYFALIKHLIMRIMMYIDN